MNPINSNSKLYYYLRPSTRSKAISTILLATASGALFPLLVYILTTTVVGRYFEFSGHVDDEISLYSSWVGFGLMFLLVIWKRRIIHQIKWLYKYLKIAGNLFILLGVTLTVVGFSKNGLEYIFIIAAGVIIMFYGLIVLLSGVSGSNYQKQYAKEKKL